VRWTRRILVVALFVAALYVCFQFPTRNAAPVRVDLLLGAFEALPLWVALLGAFAVGVVVSGLLAAFQVLRIRLLARRYRKQARGLERELHELRNLPLVGADATGEAQAPDSGIAETAVPERGV
jgi:uncharacterized integral membrane protein